MTERQHMRLRTGKLFRHLPIRGDARTESMNRYWAVLSGVFAKKRDMSAWLGALTVPASGRWMYGRIPKAGTTTVLAALYYLEFGTPITTKVVSPSNISPDYAQRTLDNAGVFMSPLQTTHGPEILSEAFRFTVLREPTERAISSFRYVCKSHTLSSHQFATVRLRMSAMVKFDWERDSYSAEGYEKFLDFLEASSGFGRFPIDGHIAPQTQTMSKALLKPDLVGRTEEMPAFLNALAERFDRKLPPRVTRLHLNENQKEVPLSISRAAKEKTARVFADDFEWYESVQ